jgi:hypothetical protein
LAKPLIVGVDPGTTVGLAFLDIDGKILDVKSFRNISIDGVITEIASVGSATVVASDKARAPPFVSKLSGILGARLFSPDKDLLVTKKRELASGWGTKNDHERDALAAAVYAYYNFQNKIRRVEKQVMEQLEGMKGRVLRGEKVSDMMAEGEESNREKVLEAQLRALRRQVKELEESPRSKGPATNQALINSYEKQIMNARGILDALRKDELVFLKWVPSLSYLDLKDSGIESGDLLFSESDDYDNKGVKFLEGRRVGGVITPAKVESLTPVIPRSDVRVVRWENFFFTPRLEIEQRIRRRREVTTRGLEELIVDYKSGRR